MSIPAFTIEAGGAYTNVGENVEQGKAAVFAILGKLGVTDSPKTRDGEDTGLTCFHTRTNHFAQPTV